jgi:quinol monooxygenase YgiN
MMRSDQAPLLPDAIRSRSFKEAVGLGTLPSPTSSFEVGELPMKANPLKDSGDSVMRYARNIHFQIKSGKEQEFTGLFEKEVVPMLRKQNGFVEEVTLVNPKGAYAISIWDDRKSADAYQTSTYPQVLAKLTNVIQGTPTIETYENAVSYARA